MSDVDLVEALHNAVTVQPGAVVILRGISEQAAERLDAMAEQIHHTGVLLVIMDDGVTVEQLDEDQMASCGWVRSTTVDTGPPAPGRD